MVPPVRVQNFLYVEDDEARARLGANDEAALEAKFREERAFFVLLERDHEGWRAARDRLACAATESTGRRRTVVCPSTVAN